MHAAPKKKKKKKESVWREIAKKEIERKSRPRQGRVKELVAQSFLTLCDPMDCSLCPWNSPGKNTGVGFHSLCQGIILTKDSNPGLMHCRQVLYWLSLQGFQSRWDNSEISKKKSPGDGGEEQSWMRDKFWNSCCHCHRNPGVVVTTTCIDFPRRAHHRVGCIMVWGGDCS